MHRALASKHEGIAVPAGSTFEVHSGGGGGWGRPEERAEGARRADRRDGYVRRARQGRGAGTSDPGMPRNPGKPHSGVAR